MANTPPTFWLFRLIDSLSRPAVLAILMAAYLLFPLWLFPAAAGGTKQMLLDLMFAYTPAEAYAALAAVGPVGREIYALQTLPMDVAYSVSYSFMFSVWLTLLLRDRIRCYRAVSMLPFAIFMFDTIENTGIALLLANYPREFYWLALATSVATTVKWLFAWPVILLSVGLSIWRAGQFLLSHRQ